MLKNKFQLDSGRVYFEGKQVGHTHTSTSTGEIKAVAVIGKVHMTVFGMNHGECETLLYRSYMESIENDD